ncbi:MAG TPA: hypothetical protein VN478_05940 [Clostridia bacterium]|nr:hypothetical protein [Clostridia bacterium]
MFLFTTLKFGWRAVAGAMAAEFVLRIATTGFCGAFTQSLRYVQPAWQGGMVTLLVLPLTMQLLELGLHLLRGTPNLRVGVGVSTGFTILSTLFHVYATRQGAYLTGAHATSLGDDLRRTPRLLAGFLALRWCALDKTEKDGNVSADSPVLHQAARPRRPSCSR